METASVVPARPEVAGYVRPETYFAQMAQSAAKWDAVLRSQFDDLLRGVNVLQELERKHTVLRERHNWLR